VTGRENGGPNRRFEKGRPMEADGTKPLLENARTSAAARRLLQTARSIRITGARNNVAVRFLKEE